MRGWTTLCLMTCLLAFPACVRWRPVAVPEPPQPPHVVTNKSRIRLKTGHRVNFLTLVVAPDSAFGIRDNDARTRLTVSYDQVDRIEVRQKDAPRTLALLGAIGFGLLYTGALGYKLK